ncbi:MAG: hypothetical protein WDN31_16480 [Hyphomicrobium sp.]
MPKDEYPLRAFLSCAALGVLIIYFAAQQIPAWRDTLFRFAAATCCLLIGFQAIYQALLIRSWVRFTDAVGPVVAGGQRPVTSLIDTGLFQDHRLQRLTWTWTMPALGYLLAPGGRVETVVENCYNDMRPLRVYAPPDLNRYGITYAYLNKFGTDTKPPASQPVVTVDGDRWVARDIQVPREGLRVRLDRSLRVAWDRTLMTADPRDAYLVRYISGGNVVAVEERGPDTLSSRYTPNGASAVEIPPSTRSRSTLFAGKVVLKYPRTACSARRPAKPQSSSTQRARRPTMSGSLDPSVDRHSVDRRRFGPAGVHLVATMQLAAACWHVSIAAPISSLGHMSGLSLSFLKKETTAENCGHHRRGAGHRASDRL